MTREFVLGAVLALALSLPAEATIARTGYLDCANNAFCFNVWPDLPAIEGWEQDLAASRRFNGYFLVPKGTTFQDAPMAIVGMSVPKAKYHNRYPRGITIDQFIDTDIAQTHKDRPEADVSEIEPIITADGQKARTFLITKMRGGRQQILSFLEDYDSNEQFCVSLMLDSADDATFQANLETFKAMVRRYKH